ncbi:hypothetical protein [Sphingomonas sp.]|jgi:hypothetical protein|uniref:hypothetical protein n=1 Tax=Sphingomonas sp. TaxID=28214 RepID=UPI0026397B6F|nr:hypothetical protein [Sphingomonas sp.]MDF2603034.1 hypothetical protein [Sphingomonas sp.]
MDELLQKARERRDQLRRELEAVEKFIHEYTTNVAPARHDGARVQHADLFYDAKEGRAERVAAMMDDAERMILQEGRPLTRFQLLGRLLEAGHHIVGSDRSKVLGTNLWRSRRFHNIQGAGYWPKSKPIPAPYDTMPLRETSLS